jgi:hypothetical protein
MLFGIIPAINGYRVMIRTGLLHLGPCIRALCAPHWNSFLPSSPEALRSHQCERPLLARKGNWREFNQQPVIHRRSWNFWHAPKLGHGADYFTSPPKEGMLRIFSHRKTTGSNPRTREPEAIMLTIRPPKPSWVQSTVTLYLFFKYILLSSNYLWKLRKDTKKWLEYPLHSR